MCGWLSSRNISISVIREAKSSSDSFFLDTILTAVFAPVA
jgi:hypothetical protein